MRHAAYNERVDEVGVLRHSHTLFRHGKSIDLVVGRTITTRKIKGVRRVMAQLLKARTQPFRLLRVNQKVHAARD